MQRGRPLRREVPKDECGDGDGRGGGRGWRVLRGVGGFLSGVSARDGSVPLRYPGDVPGTELSVCTLSLSGCGSMLVDTGCDRTLLPMDFEKFVVKRGVGPRTRVELGGLSESLEASAVCTVRLPIRDINGRVHFCLEECVLCAGARFPLLGCMSKAVVLGLGSVEKVRLREEGP